MPSALKYILYLLFLPFWWLQRLVPRNKNIWVFGAWNGLRYADNSRSLFLYVRNKHPEIKAIWLSRDNAIVTKVWHEGGSAYSVNSLKGIYFSLLAKYVLISSGRKDVNSLFINGAKWIQLWHGSPAKKIGLDDKYSNLNTFFHRKIVKNLFPFASELTNHKIVSNAAFFTPILASAFGVSMDRILETGSPRNDVFFNREQHPFNRELREKFVDCKIVYYLPTFRGGGVPSSLFSLKEYDSKKVESFLERQNIVLVSKGHFVDNRIATEDEAQRVYHLSDDNVDDLNFMLKDSDLLITDYSSIYFDFLLIEKPVIFGAFDLEEYTSGKRELPFEYEEVVAGPIVKDWDSLMKSLETIWGDKKYQDLVKEKNRIFNKYHDAENSKRVFEAVSSL